MQYIVIAIVIYILNIVQSANTEENSKINEVLTYQIGDVHTNNGFFIK